VGSLEAETSALDDGVASPESQAGSPAGLVGSPDDGVASPDCPAYCADPTRPLRRDAERNRQRILKAASEVFTEFGLDVTLDEVARHAGVGVGTVYRRFGTKEDLVAALFEDRVDTIATLAERAAEEPDPWTGLVRFMEQAAELLADDLGLRQLLMFATYGRDHVAYARQRNQPLVERLLARAQAAGQVRGDLGPTDIPFIVFVLTEATVLARQASPDIWRRYLTLIMDGMRPAREGVTPLPVPALLPGEMEKSMRESAPRHR
jgi:AcrR family transcriptional regulator